MNELRHLPEHAFTGPVKHSVTIAGHQTSISLEPVFWDALQRAAREEGIAVNMLVARIDEARIANIAAGANVLRASPHPPANLASAVRSWLWRKYACDP